MKKNLKSADLRIEKTTSAKLTDNTLREIAGLFRKIFCNAYGQYLLYPSEGKPISPQEVFQKREFIPLDRLDGLAPLPQHPTSGEKAIFWHHPDKTLQRFREKLRHQAHLILMRKPDGKLSAMTFGYRCSLEEAFQNEEWENPHHYSELKSDRYLRNFEHFLKKVGDIAAAHRDRLGEIVPKIIDGQMPVYVWNCVVLVPDLQGHGLGPELIRVFFEWIRQQDQKDALQLGEVMPDSLFHNLLKSAGAIDVPQALGDSGILLEIASLSKLADHFSKKSS